jgi:hypothetical protein
MRLSLLEPFATRGPRRTWCPSEFSSDDRSHAARRRIRKGLPVPRTQQASVDIPSRRRTEQYLMGDQPPYRLNVIGADVADVVQSVGGWLYDQIAAGWQVLVSLAQPGDERALTILGVAEVTTGVSLGNEPNSLAVSSQVLRHDDAVLGELLAILGDGSEDVTVWDSARPAEIDGRLSRVERRMSPAARAFKTHAVRAVTGSMVVVEDVERWGFAPARSMR